MEEMTSSPRRKENNGNPRGWGVRRGLSREKKDRIKYCGKSDDWNAALEQLSILAESLDRTYKRG